MDSYRLSFYFTKNPQAQSSLYVGGVKKDLFQGVPQCFDVTKEHYWEHGMRGVGWQWGED